jgi:nicotinate-nucleotide adenylyltransferase
MTSRIGIYSGTFDPVHAGHIAFAAAALHTCQLDEVVFLPEKRPRGKQNVTTLAHRKVLLEKAIEHTPGLRVVELPSDQFTPKQTLRELRQILSNADLTLLIGSDVVNHLFEWPDIDILLSDVSLAIGIRAGDTQENVARVLQAATLPSSSTFIHTPLSSAASSHIRNGDATHLTPSVIEYIDTHTLYPQISH